MTVTQSQDVTEWVANEYEQRIQAGKSTQETAEEVKALVEEFGRVNDVWQATWGHVLQYIYGGAMRATRRLLAAERQHIAAATVPASRAAMVQNEHMEFGQRRVDVTLLAQPESIFDARIHVGKDPGRWMRYGEMHAWDWEVKEQEYKVAADNGTARWWAAGRIKARLVGDKTVEECFTADEFTRMIPAIGF